MDPHDPTARPSLAPRVIWGTHAALVLLVGAFVLAAASADVVGANIGLGLGLFALGALGAPWTIPALLDGTLSLDSSTYVLTAVAGTLANVALHAAAWLWWTRRRRAGSGH